jgi:hypothetical protein
MQLRTKEVEVETHAEEIAKKLRRQGRKKPVTVYRHQYVCGLCLGQPF